MGTAFGWAVFIALILFAIFFHELGHYVTARWARMKISRFFIGFGPTIWSTRRGQIEKVRLESGEEVVRPETEYGVKALPLGGFVKIVGMSAFEEVPPDERARTFKSAPAYKQAIVLLAGSVTHFISAFVVLMLIFSVFGVPDPDRPSTTIDTVFTTDEAGEELPAYAAGIRPGDRIVSIDGRPVPQWDEVRDTIRANPGVVLSVGIERADGTADTVQVTPSTQTEAGEQIGVIGVAPQYASERVNPVAGVVRSAQTTWMIVSELGGAAPRAFSPANLGLVPGEDPGEERAVSIYGAGRIAASAAAQGQLLFVAFFFVQINIFIGLFNLLPLPPLDGGLLTLLGIEKIRGKEVHPRVVAPIIAIVFGLLMVLMFTLLYQDIVRPIDPFG